MHMPELPLIDRIKIVNEMLGPIVKELEAELGIERAHGLVRRGASARFRELARQAMSDSDGNVAVAMRATQTGVRPGVDLDVDVKELSADAFDMDVTGCVYARFFQEIGEPELGFLLVCSADFDFVEELPGVELTRTETIMQGSDRCDFRYRFLDVTGNE